MFISCAQWPYNINSILRVIFLDLFIIFITIWLITVKLNDLIITLLEFKSDRDRERKNEYQGFTKLHLNNKRKLNNINLSAFNSLVG